MIINVTCGDRRTAYQVDKTTTEVSWIIKDLTTKNFQLPFPPDHYVLQYPESGEYLSNQNLNMYLRENVDLVLKLSPAVEAAEAASYLRSNDEVKKKKAIFSLQKQFQDPEFAMAFIRRNGIDVMVELLNTSTGNTAAYTLASLQTLMTRGEGWTNLTNDFILKIVSYLMNPSINICRPAAAILIELVRAGPNSTRSIKNYGFQVVHDAMKAKNAYAKVVEGISESDVETQLNSLLLINSLFTDSTGNEQNELMEKLDALNARKIMMRLMQSTPNSEVNRAVINFQMLYHGFLTWKKGVHVSRAKPEHNALLQEILTAAEVTDITKLGFKSSDFDHEMATVGLLGLENMNYFAKKNKDFFSKYILEQNNRTDGKSCPFSLASIEMTKLLLDHCRVQSDSDERESVLLGFEDVHTFGLQSLFKLWAEMQASSSDIGKVINLMRTQLDSIKKKEPSFDQYKSGLASISYTDLQKKQLQVMEAGDDLLMKSTVKNLRNVIFKEATEFMKVQLTQILLKGSWFQNYTQKGRSKGYRFYRLSPNKKYLHYAEFPDIVNPSPSLDNLPEKIDLHAADLVIGQMCPLFSGKKGRIEDAALAFSLMPKEGENSLADFVADNNNQFAEWTDGLRVMLGKELTKAVASEATMGYISSLTDMEIKLRMLDLRSENVQIPNESPEVPPPPPNFNFNFA